MLSVLRTDSYQTNKKRIDALILSLIGGCASGIGAMTAFHVFAYDVERQAPNLFQQAMESVWFVAVYYSVYVGLLAAVLALTASIANFFVRNTKTTMVCYLISLFNILVGIVAVVASSLSIPAKL